MKKIALALLFMTSALGFSQAYPNYNSGYDGYYNNQNDYYNDDTYFPDDYYYQYPQDYYTPALYQDYYNDYRQSISMINWNKFFRKYRLSPWQINQIIYLNQMYSSYAAWDAYYRYNPDRWYYDRFFALQNILGPQVFVVFQNVYYNGYNPVSYYRDYRMKYYAPAVFVRPVYRNVNINIYRMNPRTYHKDYGYFYSQKNGFDFKNAPNGFRNQNDGFRSSTRTQNTGNGFRDDNAFNSNGNSSQQNGFRGPSSNNTVRTESSNSGFRTPTPQIQENAPRGNSGNEGFRSGANGNSIQKEGNRNQSSENSNRGSGFRSGDTRGFR